MDTHLSVTAVRKWMGTVSGNQDTGLHILGKRNTILGRRTAYFVQFVELIKIWLWILPTEAFTSSYPIAFLKKR